jgi:hypothetical protein
MQVLLSAPRAGSSYGYEQVHEYNLTLPNVKYIGVEEYLDPNQLCYMTLEQKINFLKSEKDKGINYTFKHHINYLGDYYENWFKEFYKDDEILILKRKDKWKWFLSFLFQDYNSWSTAAIKIDNNLYSKDINENWTDYDYNRSLKQFFEITEQLNRCEGKIIYYEDYYHTSKKYKKLSSLVDYESYFLNIHEIKEHFADILYKRVPI